MDMNKVAAEEPETQKQVDLPENEAEFTADPLEKPIEEEKPEEKPQEAEVDYKALYEAEKQKLAESTKRYAVSSKEGRKLKAKLKQLEAERVKATAESITDEELMKKYRDWEDYTSQEQKAIRRAENAERRAAMAEEMQKKFTQEDQLTQELDDFLDLAEAEGSFPDVRDQADEFKRFVKQSGNAGKDIEELAKIFTFDHPHQAPSRKPSTPFGNPSRQQEVIKPKKMSWQQEEALRKSDPRKYEKMLEQGLLD